MAYIKFSKTKKGILVARIQVSGKDPETGEFKVYPGHGAFTQLSYERQFNPYMSKV